MLAMIAAPTTTTEGMSTKDHASHMKTSTVLRHALRTKATTGAVVETDNAIEVAIEVANGIDTTATEIDMLSAHLDPEVHPPTNTAVETSGLAIDLSEKVTLTDMMQGNCGMTMPT